MSKFSCDTVRDMLPLYVDDIVSDDTRAIVEEHLASCDACQKEYGAMKNAVVLPADGDAKQLKRFKGAWKKKRSQRQGKRKRYTQLNVEFQRIARRSMALFMPGVEKRYRRFRRAA